MKTVAIIGGGFSGTMAAVNLVRLSRIPVHVQLINHRHPAGRGVAYGTKRAEHLLNVPARNMSAVPDRPNHFLEWLRTRVEFGDLSGPQLSESFVPRRVYGDYLRSLLLNYVQPILDAGFILNRIARMRQNLIDASAGHHVAAKEQTDGIGLSRWQYFGCD